jgi:hypothetical protein
VADTACGGDILPEQDERALQRRDDQVAEAR